jgi:hypothetical protein
MFEWLKRRPPNQVALGFSSNHVIHQAWVPEVATAFGQGGHLTMFSDPDALLAHRELGEAALVVLAASDADVAPLAARVAEARAHGSEKTPCLIAVLAEDPLVQIAARDADANLSARNVRIRPLSRTATAARHLLADIFPPDRVLRLAEDGMSLPFLIVGTPGPMASQLLLALLRLAHLPGIKPMVTLAGTGMPALLEKLRVGLPELDAIGGIFALEDLPVNGPAPAMVLAIGDTPDDTALRRLDPGGLAPIVRPSIPAFRDIVARWQDDSADRVARGIHKLHLEERLAAGQRIGGAPSLAEWDDLPERFREASRHQASHIPLKLRHAGARAADSARPPAAPFAWTEAELAALTMVEHERWAAVSRAEGWSFGATRDDVAKRTPLLVPFAALSQEIRDLDVLPVRAAPRQLAQAGQHVARDLIVAVRASQQETAAGFEAGLRDALRRLARPDSERQIVVRIEAISSLTRAAIDAARAERIPVHLALRDPPSGTDLSGLAGAAERVAIGAAVAMLPTATRSIALGDVAKAATDLFHLDISGRPVTG